MPNRRKVDTTAKEQKVTEKENQHDIYIYKYKYVHRDLCVSYEKKAKSNNSSVAPAAAAATWLGRKASSALATKSATTFCRRLTRKTGSLSEPKTFLYFWGENQIMQFAMIVGQTRGKEGWGKSWTIRMRANEPYTTYPAPQDRGRELGKKEAGKAEM